METAVEVGTTLLVMGVMAFTVWLRLPRNAERLGRSAWVGIRTPASGASDQAWVDVHRAFLPVAIGAVVVTWLAGPTCSSGS
ncbi:SdpI family protein [Kytococcus sedentarius]|uniref:SdpI/YhfL protein family n=1 Tax=Kytococcus sedentarius (strain ATCC 14392 / DSM 20547 / JCM 11482 / CCUG 33030 / NBRC 15357 / NCTC 11040 / CCM 314 / 541) TaxID=478801 RepID=C7NGF8_KYTSD|nr:SdpI family protein [Kytococcus sedentarius]ACV06066.1 hypothetical protein Ksed_10210 [Kytococcus sedentarius DSM 20547]QQB64433.1 SdpI family protein [Kytococcus sedentarius]STX12516.1 Uncharacterised protein [Kytococcus sedentarius]